MASQPLAFAEQVVDTASSIRLRAIRGNMHGDLHGFNVLVSRQSEVKPEYYLIDLDLYRDDGFLFFDHAYFELTYLVTERDSIEPSRWKSILNTLSPRAYMQEEDVVTGDDVGMLQLVNDMRDKVKTWIDRHEPNRLSYMESQCLMGRIAAGLALSHQTRSSAVRAMAFLYAATSLQDFLTLHDIDWPKNGPAFSYDHTKGRRYSPSSNTRPSPQAESHTAPAAGLPTLRRRPIPTPRTRPNRRLLSWPSRITVTIPTRPILPKESPVKSSPTCRASTG